MRVIDRYNISSIVNTTLVTLALCTLMLLSVDLFSNLDSYIKIGRASCRERV